MSDKLLEHFKKMQDRVVKYLTAGHDKHFISDMIYMLDGPEQREAEAAHGWQSIETAPKDWSNVLVYDHTTADEGNDDGVHLAWFDLEENGWLTHIHAYIHIHPTHWMPLPTPPGMSK